MTILFMVQRIATRLQVTSPTTAIGNTDNNVLLIIAMIEETLDKLAREYPWPELQNEYTFTLATSTASYPLPTFFDSLLSETLWNKDQRYPMVGPISPQLWQRYKSGLIVSLPRERFRIKGWSSNQFFVDPTPSASENGQTIVFEYISSMNRRPKTWLASTVWTGNAYCSYNGNFYSRGSTGAATSGTTPPTHTVGSVSDGSITWTYSTTPFITFTNDTDEVILDNQIVEEGALWRFKRERGLDYQALQEENEKQIELAKTRLTGASPISIRNAQAGTPMLSTANYPDGNYGI